MGDLGLETAVEAMGDGRYRAMLSQDWEIWGPMGGYVAAVALRAAGAESGFRRPASFSCHYLGIAAFATVDAQVTVLRRGRAAESLRVSLIQNDRPFLEALVWAVDDDLPGLEHHLADPPDVPGPEGLPDVEELVDDGEGPPFPFWLNFDSRPLDFIREWPPPGPLPAVWRGWLRFKPVTRFDDPWLDAARALILLDVQSWPAAHRHHAWSQPAMIAPSLDLSVAFHQHIDSEWLLTDGFAPVARDGLIGWNGRLWSESRRLVASGGGQLLCRPMAPTGS